ncbi:MAG: efflux RND transporter periplasmic adaptor subunit [Pirellulaceae bacterium]|nr:efflux RND transporter periplasmic adaptor subunit [Pirellulaceae bacterium]
MTAKPYAAGALVLAGLLSAGCEKPVAEPEIIRPVRVLKVGDLKAIQGREFPGRAQAKTEVDLSFQVSGTLASLPVDVGTEVKKGDVIAALDPRDFQAALDTNEGNLERARANLAAMEKGARPEELEQLKAAVEQAEASYRQAYAEHERNAALLPKGAISKSEHDVTLARAQRTASEVKSAREALNIGLKGAREEDLDAKRAEIKALEAAVANAKNQLEYAVLKAPFDGTVAARYVDNFQTVQAKQTIVRLLDVSKIEVTVQIPENVISLVPRVKKTLVRFDALPGKDFTGAITKVGSEASQTTRTYPVTVELDQQDEAPILPGMAAIVRRHPDEQDETDEGDLLVSPAAIFTAAETGQQAYVWVVDEGSKQVSRRPVTTGQLTPVGIQVTEGLKRGEWVVTAGVFSLREGQQVTILQEGGE